MSAGEILIADDDSAIRTVLNQALSRAGYTVRVTSNMSTLWNWLSNGAGDLVISDVVMPDGNGFELLPRIRKHRPELPVLIMSAQNTFMTAIKASELGAYEYLPKPFDLSEVINIISRALSEPRKNEIVRMEGINDDMPLVGRSAGMQDVYRVLARMMQSDLTLMISGESGTGKELVARALHDYGKRKNGPFVAVNMAAIPRDLIEAELFGYEKGAFPGALQRTTGRFEQANGGTLFLDEIGDMPIEAQIRLLRVLQQGEYTTIGGRTPIKTNVRIVAASNKDLGLAIRQGNFREDLYYRLNVVPLRLPPLRERTEDILDLVQHFLKQIEQNGVASKQIEPDAIAVLKYYQWPGNVRELENFIRRLSVLYSDDVITAEIVEAELEQSIAPKLQQGDHGSVTDLAAAVESYLGNYFGKFGDGLPPRGLYYRILREVEYPLITACLAATNGNQIKAAELLGLNRNTLRKKIQDLDIMVVKSSR